MKSKAFLKFVENYPCAVDNEECKYEYVNGERKSIAHHSKNLGVGYKDDASAVSLCWWHHEVIHGHIKTKEGKKSFNSRHKGCIEARRAEIVQDFIQSTACTEIEAEELKTVLEEL